MCNKNLLYNYIQNIRNLNNDLLTKGNKKHEDTGDSTENKQPRIFVQTHFRSLHYLAVDFRVD